MICVIQTVILACHPVVSALNRISLQNTVALLYVIISSFHIIRSILFKYPALSWVGRPAVFLHTTAIFVLIANSCFQEFRAKAYCLSQVLAGLMRFFVRPQRGCEE